MLSALSQEMICNPNNLKSLPAHARTFSKPHIEKARCSGLSILNTSDFLIRKYFLQNIRCAGHGIFADTRFFLSQLMKNSS